MKKLTDEELSKLEELERKATPGEWIADSRVGMDAVYPGPQKNCLVGPKHVCEQIGKWDKDKGIWNTDSQYECDFTFIAAARNALPALIAEIREWREKIKIKVVVDGGDEN